MKAKKILAILCSIVMFCNIQVFAQEQYTTWQYTQPPQYVTKEVEVRNGTISFTTRCEKHRIDCRCSPELDISIKESNVGILQDGDILYFETSKYHDKYFKSVAYEFVTKGITVKEVKLPEENENCFAMRISRTNKNELAQIDVRLGVDLRGENYKDEYFIPFSLYLDTDKTKEHNLFVAEQNILLNEHFLVLTDGIAEREQLNNDVQQKFKESLPSMQFLPENNIMMWNEKSIQLKHNVYINQKGNVMLSLQDLEFIINNVGGTMTNIGDDANIDIDVYDVAVGKYIFNIVPEKSAVGTITSRNQKQTMYDVLEEKDEVCYISLRAVAAILDMEDHIVWDSATKVITISNRV